MTTYKAWGGAATIALAALFVVLGLTMTASAAPVSLITAPNGTFESLGDLTGWTADAQWQEAGFVVNNGVRAARVQGNTGVTPDNLSMAVSTIGYTDVTLSYAYRNIVGLESADHLRAQYSTNGGANWTTLIDHTNQGAGGWQTESFVLPLAASNNPSVMVRFQAAFNGPFDAVRIDDVAITGAVIPSCDTDDTTFDTFSNGSVSTQHGWVSIGAYDQAVVPNVYGYEDFGCKTLRISNAVTSGSFSDQTFSYSVANEAGETSAATSTLSGGVRQNHFEAQFDLGFASTTYQPGLIMSVSLDRGDGARMSYLRFEDQADGIHAIFAEYDKNTDLFPETQVAILNRAESHTIKFNMEFVDGTDNDIVNIDIDGVNVHTGGSWEDYFREQEHNPSRTVDSLLFRVGGTAAPANSGKGFLIDNVVIETPDVDIDEDETDVVVEAADLAADLPEAVSTDSWFFYNDENDTINNALGSFVDGPATAPEGDGSVQISVTGTERRNLATYQFADVQLSTIKVLKFSTYNPSAGNGGSADRSGYLHFNVSFDGADTWQRRLVYVPSNNGSVTQNSWQEWDAVNSGNAKWSYSGPTWPTTAQGVSGVSGTTLKTWSQILADYPDARTRTTDSFMGIRVGEPYADGYTENIDKFSLGILDGDTIEIETFDFEPTQIETPELLGWNVQGEAADLESYPITLECNPEGVVVNNDRNSLNQRWTTVDGSNVKYVRQVSADNGATWNVLTGMVFTGPSMNGWFSFGPAEDGGTFLTEVMAFSDVNSNNLADDGTSNTSGWSNPCEITYMSVDTLAPSVPILTSPTNGTTLNTNEFDFVWEESTDDQPGNITYEFRSSLDGSQDVNGDLVSGLWVSGTLPDPTIHSTGAPDGAWHWQVRAKDVAGNWSDWSDVWTVTLDTAPVPPPATPGVTTNAATAVTASNATLNATNNAIAADNTSFWWGTTAAGPFTSAADPSGQLPSGWSYHPTGFGATAASAPFSYPLSGLSSGTTYYFVAWSQVGGVWYPGSVLSFSSTGDTAMPSATTNAATGITMSDATLNGTNGPVAAGNTSFWWGTAAAGQMTPAVDPSGQLPSGWSYHPTGLGAAATGGSFSHALSGLAASTQYHFVAWSQVGGTWYPGSTEAFTTESSTPTSAPTLTIVKHTIGGNGTFNFILSGTSTTAELTTVDNWATSTAITLNTGSTTISELAIEGWDLTNSSCVYDNESAGISVEGGHEISVDNGDDVTCTFTNTAEGAPQIDLSVLKSVSDSTPDEGQTVVYTITAANLSEFAAMGVEVSDVLPAGVSFVSASSSVGTYVGNTWTIGTLFSGATAMLEITVTVNSETSGNTILNSATVSSDQTDPTPANNTDDASLTVNSGSTENTNSSETVVVTPSALNGWAFNSDRDTWVMGTGEFMAGPSTTPLSTGSARLTTPTNDNRAAFRKYLVAGTQISDIKELKYSTYRTEPTGGALALALQFDVDMDSSPVNPLKADGRIVYEPYYTQTTLDDTWQTWDALSDSAGTGTGNWWIAGPNGGASCTMANPCTWTELNANYPDLRISAESLENQNTDGAVLFKAGGSWAGFDGNVDKFVFGLKTGSNIHTTTYDFEPVAPQAETVTDTDSGGGSGGHSFRRSTSTGGEVLGAETGPNECSALLKTYMRLGADNDTVQVMLLQNFLNIELGTTLAVSGIFDLPTDTAVRAFQTKYADEILPPWGLTEPTGYVYTLTQWKINDIACPGTPKPGVTPIGPGGQGGMGDGTTAPGNPAGGVAAGVVLGDENATTSSAGASSTPKNPVAAALGLSDGSLPPWFWLLVLALIILGGSSWYAYNKNKTA